MFRFFNSTSLFVSSIISIALVTNAHSQTGNYCGERTQSTVLPQTHLQDMVGTLTPSTIPDAKVVTTNDLIEAMKSKSDFLLVDAWDDDDHNEIPGSTHINYAGNPGNFDDEIQSKLLHAMNDLVGGNPNYPVVFYCAGPNCWESYNAALRAEAMGLNNVYWYRGGLCAWQEAVSESSRTPTTPRRRSYSNDAPYSNYSPPSYTPPVDTYGSCINACNNINAYTNSGMAAEQSCLASCH